jgi:hypothetical protein
LGTEQALANAVNDAIGLDLLVRTSTVHRATLP